MKFKPKSAGGKNFLRLKAGEAVRGVFRGDPVDFKQHWSENRGVVCKGDGCEYCEEKKPGFRFRLNFIIKENEAYVAKIFEQGWIVYEQLQALHEGDYNLEQHLMKIQRHGQGKDTTYSIIPVPNGQITKAQDEQIKQVKLHDLSPDAPTEAEQADTESETDEDIPF